MRFAASLHSAAVPRAEKRQRKKENAARAREAREAAERRARLRRNLIRGAIVAVIAVGIFLVISLTRDDADDVSTTGTSSPTTALPATTAATATTGGPSTTAGTTTSTAAVECSDETPAGVADKPTFEAPEQVIEEGVTYTATIETSCGTIVAELDSEHAPEGVNNFVFLARQGFYDGLTWHRVVGDFVIQGGDPEGTGAGGPGYDVVTETPQAGYEIGDLAYAKGAADPPGTAGSQFFIVTGENGTTLPPDYGRFGHVVAGLEVAQRIESFSQGDGPPTRPLYIFSVEITES